jgi:hypothetical protein
MLTIKLDLDEEFGVDEIDVLGDLTISDGQSAIVVKATFLDSWLEELVSAANRLPSMGQVAVEAPEEPAPIRIELGSDKRITLSREGQIVVANSMADFNAALKDAAKSLLEKVDNLPRSRQNASLDPIREYYLRVV